MSTRGYVEAFDPRRSGRVSVQSFALPSASTTTSIPVDLLISLLLSKSLLAVALFISRDWLLAQGFSISALNAVSLSIAAVLLAFWEQVWNKPRGHAKRREEPSTWLYSLLVIFESLTALLVLSKMNVTRFMMLSSFSALWARGVPIHIPGAGVKRAQGKVNAIFITSAMVGASYLLDSLLTSLARKSAYGLLLAHLLVSGQRADLLGAYTVELQGRAHALGTLGGAAIAIVVAFVSYGFYETPLIATKLAPHLPQKGVPTFNTFSAPDPTVTLLISAAALLAITYHVVDPLLSRALLAHFPPARQVSSGWPLALASTAFVGYVGFGHGFGLADFVVAVVAWAAISNLVASDPRASMISANGSSFATPSRNEPFLARVSTLYRHLRATIKTILASDESRRIYFFLCLNLAFMFVQMAYGIWTNSLGLISDSIHMFFDCLALGMGLFASVMATWESNDKFTFGYSRVETLSGFANGLFLCLISIFIVFEAIQRLLDPPEMNTGQLLIVSSLGLAVNLVGMVATGHNHHGHSHGGGHSHGPHGESSKPKTEKKLTNGAHNGHSHASQSHDHSGHSHAAHGSDEHDDDGDDDDDEHDEHGHGAHSHNMKGVFLHVMADTLGSVGVIISTLLINRYGWTGFDPLASIFIAVLIFASVVPLVADSGRLLILDLGDEREAEVRKALLKLNKVEGLSSYTAARFWCKDSATIVGSISIQLAPSPSSQDPTRPEASLRTHQYADIERVMTRVRKLLRSSIAGLSDGNLTVQVEPTTGFSF